MNTQPPSTHVDSTNPFSEVITFAAVRDILTAQVEKARKGDTAAANLVLKIAAASAGIDSSSRKNPGTPVAKPPGVSLIVATLNHTGPLSVDQLAGRFGCEPEDIQLQLERSTRFSVNSRGLWSVAPIAAIGS